MRLWAGLTLQAAATDRQHALKNALRFTVQAVDAQNCKLARDDGGEPLTVPTPGVAKLFRPTHALTIDSSQALTIQGNVLITEVDHPHFTFRRLITGLGRSPTGACIQVR